MGGADTIVAGSGNNVVFGGAAGDGLKVGTSQSDLLGSVLFGDNGYVEFINGVVKTAYAIDPNIGGADTIETGDGDHLSIGGADGDTITTGAGNDIVFGDNAIVEFGQVGAGLLPGELTLLRAFSIAPTAGGNDIINTGDSNDIVIGGTGADNIHSGGGDDRVFGDHAPVRREPAGKPAGDLHPHRCRRWWRQRPDLGRSRQRHRVRPAGRTTPDLGRCGRR